jgi:branched-chain amino acid transport system ATP-binding protein
MSFLEVNALDASYGDFQALFGVDILLEEGEILALIGANGAGKSTLLRTICGLLPRKPSSIRFAGEDISRLPPHEIVVRGIAMSPEGRRLFPSLSVEENLLVGRQKGRHGEWTLDRLYEMFPVINERRNAPATTLSGGQQQLVAIGRALMANPRLLICDEVSLGLSPSAVDTVYQAVEIINGKGVAMLLVEQDIARTLEFAHRVICLLEGRITLTGPPSTLTRDEITSAYFGV